VSHPAIELDDVIHQRVRLAILAVLMEARRVDFRYLKDTLDLTDGNLSRHLRVLEEAGYVRIDKGFEGKRPRTWASATSLGRGAFQAEIHALKVIVGRFERSSPRHPTDGAVDPSMSSDRAAGSS
jgi:DNA-binding MarR family transcriptional regulator